MARKMKDSGIEWIGEIPEGWEIKYFVQLFSQVKNKNIGLREKNLLSLSYGKIKQKSIETVGGLLPDNFEGYNIIDRNDIVLRLTDLQNDQHSLRVGLSPERGIITSAYCSIRVRGAESPKYLYYYLHTFDIAKGFYGMGSGVRQGLNWDGLKYIKILLPPQHEQDRISVFLNQKTLEIDSILSKTISSIEEYKKLKQTVITQAVTKGVRGEREMKDSGVDWIGEIPVDWEISRIKYVSIFEPSCDFRKLTPETIITYSPMECIKNGTFERRTSLYGNLAHTLTPFQNGDIVMAKVTPCFENGNIAIMNELQSGYGLGSSELFVFRPQNINTRYLFYWLQNKLFVHQACATMTGTGGLKRISPSFVKNCNIHYPSTAEQAQIAAYLDTKCAEIDRLIAKKEQLVKELERYKKSLIYEVVTGKREV